MTAQDNAGGDDMENMFSQLDARLDFDNSEKQNNINGNNGNTMHNMMSGGNSSGDENMKRRKIEGFQNDLGQPVNATGRLVGGGKPMWKCSLCNYDNFLDRSTCNKCNTDKTVCIDLTLSAPNALNPEQAKGEKGKGKQQLKGAGAGKGFGGETIVMKPTKTWRCGDCQYDNFNDRDSCNKCSKPKAQCEDTTFLRVHNNWTCILCNTMNFEYRKSCFLCKNSRDYDRKWICGEEKCGADNFLQRDDCFKCLAPRFPDEQTKEKYLFKADRVQQMISKGQMGGQGMGNQMGTMGGQGMGMGGQGMGMGNFGGMGNMGPNNFGNQGNFGMGNNNMGNMNNMGGGMGGMGNNMGGGMGGMGNNRNMNNMGGGMGGMGNNMGGGMGNNNNMNNMGGGMNNMNNNMGNNSSAIKGNYLSYPWKHDCGAGWRCVGCDAQNEGRNRLCRNCKELREESQWYCKDCSAWCSGPRRCNTCEKPKSAVEACPELEAMRHLGYKITEQLTSCEYATLLEGILHIAKVREQEFGAK